MTIVVPSSWSEAKCRQTISTPTGNTPYKVIIIITIIITITNIIVIIAVFILIHKETFQIIIIIPSVFFSVSVKKRALLHCLISNFG